MANPTRVVGRTSPDGVLRALAEYDPDAEIRALAVTVLDLVPDRDRAAGAASRAAAIELAAAVHARFRMRTGFPQRLGALAGLSAVDADALLTDLVAAALAPLRRGDSRDRRSARLARVVEVLPAARAEFPDAVDRALRPWPAGLLRVVAAEELAGLTELWLTAPDAATRLHVLGLLRTVLDPGARSDDAEEELRDLVSPPPFEVAASLEFPFPAPPPLQAAATRPAYARLDAPDRVAPGRAFELRVGLAEAPSDGVVQDAPFAVPDTAFTLTVQVVAPGFRLLGGSGWERTIAISPEDPYAYDVLRLVALDGFVQARAIVAEFVIAGRPLGYATRVVEVDGADPGTGAPPQTPAAPGGVWVLPEEDVVRPDLEIVVTRGNDVGGTRLMWLCRSRHDGIDVPNGPIETVLEGSAEFVRQAIAGIEQRAAGSDRREYLLDVSRRIGEAVPAQVWAALTAIAARTGGPPTVLFATWEPYLPWELARVPAPWVPGAPRILGAQAVLGRWTYSAALRTAGPPASITVDELAVVTGDYAGALALPQAEAEAATLRAAYGATTVEALVRPILDCIEGAPRADALHVALHGNSTYSGTNDGLLMRDKSFLSPVSISGAAGVLDGRPSQIRLAFLNACQVGQGKQLLGEYAGMASAFVGVGSGAVIAPLWQVDDGVAREVAEAFWAAVLPPGAGELVSPAEQLRRERAATTDWNAPGGTRLAYLFFGHPCLRVVRTAPPI